MDSRASTFNPNKHLKEEFVSNLTGSSLLEIAALSTIVPALVVLRKCSSLGRVDEQLSLRGGPSKKNENVASAHKDWKFSVISLAMDYLFIILPVLLSFTVLAEWIYMFTTLLMLLMLFCISWKRSNYYALNEKGGSHSSSVRNIILSYRVSVVLVTCFCILAVDFNIFPRRYAKTETYGTGLMDLGVGSFIVANSLVSKRARGLSLMSWKSAFRSLIPLLLLGFCRLISTRGVDYQVHVGEYGVHWNFFFTLAAVSMLTSIINIHPEHCGIFGLLILIAYQVFLLCGLNSYLISNERMNDVISQNKEGLYSIFGYWGMYLIGVYLGYKVFFGKQTSSKSESIQLTKTRVWVLSALFWLFTIITDKYVERVSRRMCNLAYVLLVFAQNFQVISVLMLSDLFDGQAPLALEEAFSQNLLGLFLLANILTGIVNLAFDTISATSLAAISILFVYSSVLSVLAGVAWFCGFKTKFW